MGGVLGVAGRFKKWEFGAYSLYPFCLFTSVAGSIHLLEYALNSASVVTCGMFFLKTLPSANIKSFKSSPILWNDRQEFSEKIGCYSIRAARQSAILVPSGTKELLDSKIKSFCDLNSEIPLMTSTSDWVSQNYFDAASVWTHSQFYKGDNREACLWLNIGTSSCSCWCHVAMSTGKLTQTILKI